MSCVCPAINYHLIYVMNCISSTYLLFYSNLFFERLGSQELVLFFKYFIVRKMNSYIFQLNGTFLIVELPFCPFLLDNVGVAFFSLKENCEVRHWAFLQIDCLLTYNLYFTFTLVVEIILSILNFKVITVNDL